MFRAAALAVWFLAGTAAAQIVICNNADLRVVPTGLQDGFTVTQLQPVLLTIRVIDGCGQNVRLAAARAEFSNGDVPVPLTPAFDGQWAGIWAPQNRPSEDIQVIFTAIDVASEVKAAGVTVIGGRLSARADGSGALQIDGAPIRLSAPSGGSVQTRSIHITNPANLVQQFSATPRMTNGLNWLALKDAGASVPAAGRSAIVVTLDPSRLRAGTYAGAVDVVAGSRTVSVPVTFAVSSVQAHMELSTVATSFRADAAGRVEPAQQLILRNSGTVLLPWNARVSTASGGSWLRISPEQGSVPPGGTTVLQVSVNPAGLAPGDYFGRVTFVSASAANNPQLVSVYLNVAPAGSSLSSFVRPTALVFGGDNVPQQRLAYFNGTSQPVQIRMVAATRTPDLWLSVPSAVTVIPPGQTMELPVTATLTDQGIVRHGAVSVVNVTSGSSVTVPVVSVPLFTAASASNKSQKSANCTPTALQARMLSINSSTAIRVGEAKTIDAVVRDNCGSGLSATNGGSASLRVGGETIRMRDVGGGSWTATWTPRSEGQTSVTVNAVTFGPNLTPLVLQEIVTLSVQGVGLRPRSEAGGIVNAASFSAERIAPGSLITIFGSELSDGTAAPQSTPIPTTLANTEVELGGRKLPLFYSSPRQLNAQIPYDLPTETDLQLVINRGMRQSPPESVIVTSAQPAVFTVQQSGSGQGVILGPDQRTIAGTSNPVRVGDALVIYCTGLGATDPSVGPGEPAPASPPLARTKLPVSVTIDGQNAEILYSGLAPGFAGLYQLNVIVPQGVRAGSAVELKVKAADLESPAVTLSVRD